MSTDITVVLDRSGSMGGLVEQVIASFNTFLHEQQKVKDDAVISLIQFDDNYEVNYEAIDLQNTKELNASTYVPRGCTALFDAIGRTITATKSRLSNDNRYGEHAKASAQHKIIVMITTDGMENASVEYSGEMIRKMINECEDSLGWKFIYLAGNDASFEQHRDVGMKQNRAIKMGKGRKGYEHAMQMTSAKVASWRDYGDDAHLDYTESERKEADEIND